MIEKPLEQITYADIEGFVQEKWPEGKTVDYKRDTYGPKDEDKRELLKDISSFANTQGGDILIGVDEDKGIPNGIPGVNPPDLDKEKLRLEEIIRQGLEPRIEFGIHHVQTPAGSTVIIIRAKESLLFPHRVVFQQFGEFWARSSAGKYSMDTDELRRSFTLSESIYDQIRAFRKSRVALVTADETPVPIMAGGKLLLHLIPVSAFRSRERFDVATMPELGTQFTPIGASGWSERLNLDGRVSFSAPVDGSSRSYTQFFRNGIVESVLCDVIRDDPPHGNLLRPFYERKLTYETFPRFMKGFRDVGIQPPIWCYLTITGVKGARIPISTSSGFPQRSLGIDRDILLLPEFAIDDLATNAATLLRPVFDLVWNASGIPSSPNFDTSGEWIGQ